MTRWGIPFSQKALLDAAKRRTDKLQAKGKQVDFKELLRLEPDSGTHQHPQRQQRALEALAGPANRCLVPLTSFSEYDTIDGKKQGFAPGLGIAFQFRPDIVTSKARGDAFYVEVITRQGTKSGRSLSSSNSSRTAGRGCHVGIGSPRNHYAAGNRHSFANLCQSNSPIESELLSSSGIDARAQFGQAITTIAERNPKQTEITSVCLRQNLQSSRAVVIVVIRSVPRPFAQSTTRYVGGSTNLGQRV